MQTVVKNTLINYGVVNPKAKKVCLVLHGWGHKGEMWRQVIEEMPSNYKYVLVDLPGFGGSGFIEGDSGVAEYSQLIRNFCKKMGFKEVVVIGHSFGGQIGADLAIKEPKLVKKLILVAPALIRKRSILMKIRLWLTAKLSFIWKKLPKRWIESMYRKVASDDYADSSQKQRQILKNIVNYDLSEKIGNIVCPTLIAWGNRDIKAFFAGKEVCERIKNSQLRVIYGGGHNLHLEKVGELVEIVGGWLDD